MSNEIRRVVIESPYSARTKDELARNIAYAQACLADSLARGESPLAGHLLYTQVLDDRKPAERRKGMAAHLRWIECADDLIVYTDLGISGGMQEAIMVANEFNTYVEFRKLPKKVGKHAK